MNSNQVELSIQALKLAGSIEDQALRSEDSTSSASQQSRQDKLCSQLDELCQFFEKK